MTQKKYNWSKKEWPNFTFDKEEFEELEQQFIQNSAANYNKIAKTSASTTTRDLQELVDKKIFVKTGNLKSTRYFLK